MNFWLLKTEPRTYSWDDLQKMPDARDIWDGVRNYQARNFLRTMQSGDLAFFYHSVVKPTAIVGIVKIVRTAFPDPTQFEPDSPYFDPKSPVENPRWSAVEVQTVRSINPVITLEELRGTEGLGNMVLLQKGSRLSVQPVSPEEWHTILSLREISETKPEKPA